MLLAVILLARSFIIIFTHYLISNAKYYKKIRYKCFVEYVCSCMKAVILKIQYYRHEFREQSRILKESLEFISIAFFSLFDFRTNGHTLFTEKSPEIIKYEKIINSRAQTKKNIPTIKQLLR